MSTSRRNAYRRPSALGVPGAPIETESESLATFTGVQLGTRSTAFKAEDHLVAEGQMDSLTGNKISFTGQTGTRAEYTEVCPARPSACGRASQRGQRDIL